MTFRDWPIMIVAAIGCVFVWSFCRLLRAFAGRDAAAHFLAGCYGHECSHRGIGSVKAHALLTEALGLKYPREPSDV